MNTFTVSGSYFGTHENAAEDGQFNSGQSMALPITEEEIVDDVEDGGDHLNPSRQVGQTSAEARPPPPDYDEALGLPSAGMASEKHVMSAPLIDRSTGLASHVSAPQPLVGKAAAVDEQATATKQILQGIRSDKQVRLSVLGTLSQPVSSVRL